MTNIFSGTVGMILTFLEVSFGTMVFFLSPIIALSCASYVLYRIFTRKF